MALARYARNGRLELPILGSVGCVQNCTFCSRHFLHGGFRCKSPQRIIDELQHNIATYGARDFLYLARANERGVAPGRGSSSQFTLLRSTVGNGPEPGRCCRDHRR